MKYETARAILSEAIEQIINEDSGEGVYMYEDLQTEPRFREMHRLIVLANIGTKKQNRLLDKDYAERTSKKVYGMGGRVLKRRKGGKYVGRFPGEGRPEYGVERHPNDRY